MKAVIEYKADELNAAIQQELAEWREQKKVERLWQKDPSLWTNADENHWLGWLHIIESENSELQKIEQIKKDIQTEGIQSIVVLGMGGSSLCPDMMAKTFGKIESYPTLYVLDSTSPDQIQDLEDKIDIKKTLFIVSSKSGTTLEPNIFEAYFYQQVQNAIGKAAGNRFIAITDPGSKLVAHANQKHFKAIFYGVDSIGGRYSALSNFGMVPSGLMGVDDKDFLTQAKLMQVACGPNVSAEHNPAVVLGIILGLAQKSGKDKLTLIVSPAIQALGAWLEQLLAESTGKIGVGIIPIDDEPLGEPEVYGKDRIFAYIRLEEAPDPKQEEALSRLEEAGFTVIRLSVKTREHLGQTLFLWEMATAVAGSVMKINPFDQPDVEGSKVLAKQLLTDYESTQKLPIPMQIISDNGIKIFTDATNKTALGLDKLSVLSLESILQAHLSRIQEGDYVNLSAFIAMFEKHVTLLQSIRLLIRNRKKVATCLGFGPRFLHSTGQAYKGGPNTGVFFQITADCQHDILVPEHTYSFGTVISAQAEADFQVLTERSRRVIRIHLSKNVTEDLQQLYHIFEKVLQ